MFIMFLSRSEDVHGVLLKSSHYFLLPFFLQFELSHFWA